MESVLSYLIQRQLMRIWTEELTWRDEDLDPETNEIDSFELHIDNLFVASYAQWCKGHFDGIMKKAHLSVRKALERSTKNLHLIGDGASLLSVFLGLLGVDYNKFYICEKIQRNGGRGWKQGIGCIMNVINQRRCLNKILRNTRWELIKNIGDGSLNIAMNLRHMQPILNSRKVNKGELCNLVHKRIYGSYIHEGAQAIALGKEHSDKVRGVDFGLAPSQLFRPSLHLSAGRAQIEKTQRMLFELQAEVAAEKLKRKVMEDEVTAEMIK
ncbi:hypothetical protein Ahy_B10g101458 isoform A [Arachis hypogaea]|uniref:Uncharacterized protein n=1 Tax=Arachis hypogaea TaxID=3818 RepID=A0A444WZR0_ARAHY|nr:hypothetical protein Ahy_B10g101458 isoform A [Arachis hypogaea]